MNGLAVERMEQKLTLQAGQGRVYKIHTLKESDKYSPSPITWCNCLMGNWKLCPIPTHTPEELWVANTKKWRVDGRLQRSYTSKSFILWKQSEYIPHTHTPPPTLLWKQSEYIPHTHTTTNTTGHLVEPVVISSDTETTNYDSRFQDHNAVH